MIGEVEGPWSPFRVVSIERSKRRHDLELGVSALGRIGLSLEEATAEVAEAGRLGADLRKAIAG